MKILSSYNHKLKFLIDNDAPDEYVKRWVKFKEKCESGKNKHIVKQWKEYCKLEELRTRDEFIIHRETQGAIEGSELPFDEEEA